MWVSDNKCGRGIPHLDHDAIKSGGDPGSHSHRHFSPTTHVAMPQIKARSIGVAKEHQVGNIHEVTLEAVEEGHMEEDEAKEDEDEDNGEASQVREEEKE